MGWNSSRAPIPDMGPEVYARWRASGIGATTEWVEGQLILELISDVSGCRVLDIGCGETPCRRTAPPSWLAVLVPMLIRLARSVASHGACLLL